MYNSDRAENPDLVDDIEQFHTKFDLKGRLINSPIDPELLKFRVRFLAEELKEINNASAEGDLEEVLDGLVDLVYVAIGTAYMLNLNFAEAWKTVHKANMSKVKVSNENPGKRGHSTDIVKPPGWVKPDHAHLFTPIDWSHPPLTDKTEIVDLSSYFKA